MATVLVSVSFGLGRTTELLALGVSKMPGFSSENTSNVDSIYYFCGS